MRACWLLVLMPFAVALLGAESHAEKDSFMRLYYFPPRDTGGGTLPLRSVELLDSLQTLPRKVELWPSEAASAGAGGPNSGPGRDWILVPVEGVASPLKRARALAAAGRLKDAAKAYTEAARKREDDAHAFVMGATCALRRGETEDAVNLMERAKTKEDRFRDWLEWTKEIHTLTTRMEQQEVD